MCLIMCSLVDKLNPRAITINNHIVTVYLFFVMQVILGKMVFIHVVNVSLGFESEIISLQIKILFIGG